MYLFYGLLWLSVIGLVGGVIIAGLGQVFWPFATLAVVSSVGLFFLSNY